jgi:hypothetical protein
MGRTASRGWREFTIVAAGFGLLTVFFTAPLALHLGRVARLDNADTRMLIWNVAWVARTIVVDPLHLFDANIFYPHRWTLVFSESNIGAGVLAIPVYWATRNPYAAHNFVVVLSFVLSATSTYYLVRYLVRDRRAAIIAAVCFAYCPYVFSHLPHVHLLMTAGIPLSMLAFHRLVDQPSVGRGAILGLIVAAEAFFCGYYAVFVALTVGFAVLIVTITRRLWTNLRFWSAMMVAAVVGGALALPLFVPYMRLQREAGFMRPLDDARLWSATWRSYLASSAHAHSWMLPLIRPWGEVLFPGFVTLIAGIAGWAIASTRRGPLRELAVLYGSLIVVALWASWGPDGGLYLMLRATIPAFSFMHAPARFGILVVFALAVLGAIATTALLERMGSRFGTVLAAVVVLIAVAELKVPLSFSRVPPLEPAYRVLAKLPWGPVLEMPVYSSRFASNRTRYMLDSTSHWKPLVNGYSSHVPPDFHEKTATLGGFPSRASFRLLERDRVRYVVFHMHRLDARARQAVSERLRTFEPYLARRYADERVRLYEIVNFPVQD